jgi:hypothetical protein
MYAGTSADVNDPGSRDRQPSPYQFLRAKKLQASVRRPAQPGVLEGTAVVMLH